MCTYMHIKNTHTHIYIYIIYMIYIDHRCRVVVVAPKADFP